MKIKLYDCVVLLRDLVEGVDFISPYHENIKAGSIGLVLELEDDWATVEFSYEDYRNPVHSVDLVDLTLYKQNEVSENG